MSALLTAKQKGDPGGWRAFQESVSALKNQRTRAKREAEDLETSLFAAQTALRLQDEGALGKSLCYCSSPTSVLPSRHEPALEYGDHRSYFP